jgi:hypothetical protein
MNELTFRYRGKDLIKPLTELLARFDADIAATQTQIGKHLAADIEAGRQPPNLMRKATAGEAAVRKLESERIELLASRRECELWLAEAKRTPRYEWTLTMRDLANLYPLPRSAA